MLADATLDNSMAKSQSSLIQAPRGLIRTAKISPMKNRKNNQLISIEDDDGVATEPISAKEYLVLVGNRKWIKEKNFINIPEELEEELLLQEKRGRTVILAAIDGM